MAKTIVNLAKTIYESTDGEYERFLLNRIESGDEIVHQAVIDQVNALRVYYENHVEDIGMSLAQYALQVAAIRRLALEAAVVDVEVLLDSQKQLLGILRKSGAVCYDETTGGPDAGNSKIH